MHRFMILSLFGLAVSAAAEAPPPDFRRDVVPILATYCLGCHQPSDVNGNFQMHTFADLMKGGEHGPAIVAGKSAESRLYLMTSGQLEPKMPPEGEPAPSAEQIDVLRRWIDAGATGPANANEPLVADPATPEVAPRAKPRPRVFAAAWSPDGKRLALGGYRTVTLIDPATSFIEATLDGHAGMVTDVSFSGDGAILVTASGVPGVRGEVVLWKQADGTRIHTLAGHRDTIFAARLSEDGKTLATASYDKSVQIWDVAEGKVIQDLKGHNEAVYALAYRPGSPNVLASVSGDRTLKLWDRATGARLDTLSESLKELLSVSFTRDGAYVLAGGGDNRIRAWSVSASAQEGTNSLVESRFAHEGSVLKLTIDPAGKRIASAGTDSLVKLWTWPGIVEERVLEKQKDWPSALVFSPDGSELFVSCQGGSASIYDPATGSKKRDIVPTPKPPPPPTIVRVMPVPATRGQETRVALAGTNLATLREVKVSDGEISARVAEDAPPTNDQATLIVTALPQARLGGHDLRLVTAGGETAPIAVEVDTLGNTFEMEPNDALSQAILVTLPTNGWGTLDRAGDVDRFAFDAVKGQTLVFDVKSNRLGSATNLVLVVSDASGRTLASSNDDLGQPDPLLSWVVPADGRYLVSLHDYAYGGSAKHFYRLSMGQLPFVSGVYPLAIKVGGEASLELTGPNIPAGTKQTVRADQPGDVVVPIDPGLYRSRRPMVVVASASAATEVEPNNSNEQATALAVPGEASGRIDRAGDEDVFRISMEQNQTYVIETDAAHKGWDVDTRLDILHADGTPVERVWLAAVRDSYVEFRGIDAAQLEIRCKNWQEMELNQYLYMNGEVGKLFRHPRGPDSGFLFYSVGGQRRTYFDTSSSTHALEDPVYIVSPVAPGTSLVPNGLPVFKLAYSNDDASDRRLGSDSQITFTAPAKGEYLVRVVDVRGVGSEHSPYRLVVRSPAPDFFVGLEDRRPTVHRGNGRDVTFRVDRRDGFEGAIDLEVTGLPAGFTLSSPIQIEAGHESVSAVLTTSPEVAAPTAEAWGQVSIKARSVVEGSPREKPVAGWEVVALADAPPILVRVEPAQLVLAPGGTVTAKLVIDRKSHQDRVTFEMLGLPHGVIVDNIGLNGILIPEGATEREFFLSARPFVEEMDRPFFARSNEAGGQASAGVMLSIRKPNQVAKNTGP